MPNMHFEFGTNKVLSMKVRVEEETFVLYHDEAGVTVLSPTSGYVAHIPSSLLEAPSTMPSTMFGRLAIYDAENYYRVHLLRLLADAVYESLQYFHNPELIFEDTVNPRPIRYETSRRMSHGNDETETQET